MHISSRLKLTIIFSLLLLFVVGLTLRGFASIPTHAAKSTHGWRIVASPLVGGGKLNAVAAVNATNAWAVGYSTNATLIEHWNGKQWSVVANPNGGAVELNAVKAFSATNIWAVGSTTSNGSALIEHYNGAQWSLVSSPTLAPYGGGVLAGMTIVSTTDIWAAGYYNGQYGGSTLVEHYDGIQWSVVPSPDADNFSVFNAINAASATDIWAVGSSWNADDSDQSQSVLTEHWDGAQWSVVSSPSPGGDDMLNAVIAVASNDVRAVGMTNSGSNALAEHWNGIQWTYGIPPSGGVNGNFLEGEVAFATNNIWAVGAYVSSYTWVTLIEHWDGKQWTIIASPNITTTYNELLGIAKVPNTSTLWAVGDTGNGALIEFYS